MPKFMSITSIKGDTNVLFWLRRNAWLIHIYLPSGPGSCTPVHMRSIPCRDYNLSWIHRFLSNPVRWNRRECLPWLQKVSDSHICTLHLPNTNLSAVPVQARSVPFPVVRVSLVRWPTLYLIMSFEKAKVKIILTAKAAWPLHLHPSSSRHPGHSRLHFRLHLSQSLSSVVVDNSLAW